MKKESNKIFWDPAEEIITEDSLYIENENLKLNQNSHSFK